MDSLIWFIINFQYGILFNKGALWLGAHWSNYNRRWCINIVPCITIWVSLPHGKAPARAML